MAREQRAASGALFLGRSVGGTHLLIDASDLSAVSIVLDVFWSQSEESISQPLGNGGGGHCGTDSTLWGLYLEMRVMLSLV